MKLLLIINELQALKLFINIIYYFSAFGIIFFAVRLIKKKKIAIPLRTDLTRLIICACVAFITLVIKIFI